MTYTHRNGESEPPTEEGFYWTAWVPNPARKAAVVEVVRDGDEWQVWHIGNEVETYWTEPAQAPTDFRWWGPILPPWEVQP